MIALFLVTAFFLLTTNVSQSLAQQSPSCVDEDGNLVDWYIAYKMPALSNQPAPFNTGYAYAYITSDNVKGVDPIASPLRNDADLDSVIFLNKFKNLLLKYLGFSNPFSEQKVNKQKKTDYQKLNNNSLYWTISAKLISDPDSMIMRTLEVAYDKKRSKKSSGSKLNSIFYNDQPPLSDDEEEKFYANRAHAKGVILIDDVTGNGVWLTHSVSLFLVNYNFYKTNHIIINLTFHSNFLFRLRNFLHKES